MFLDAIFNGESIADGPKSSSLPWKVVLLDTLIWSMRFSGRYNIYIYTVTHIYYISATAQVPLSQYNRSGVSTLQLYVWVLYGVRLGSKRPWYFDFDNEIVKTTRQTRIHRHVHRRSCVTARQTRIHKEVMCNTSTRMNRIGYHT